MQKRKVKKREKGKERKHRGKKPGKKKKEKSSKGLSAIVATLLMVLLTLVAVAIIWIVVKNVIQNNAEQVSLGKFTLDLKISEVQNINDSALSLVVKRNPGEGDFVGINFIVEDDENTEVIKMEVSMKELETRRFGLYLTEVNASKIKKVSIAPIFKLESGKEINGDVKDEYVPGSSSGSGGTSCIPDCTGKVCGNDGCGGVCPPDNCPIGQTCSGGICVDEQTCTDTCLSLGYECGTPTICGLSTDCGTCSLTNAVSSCNPSYQCVISSCNSGYGNCDSNTANGCETILGTMTNCASCGNACTGGQTCTNYTCTNPAEYCGDGTCNGAETCSTCPGDCGTCPSGNVYYVSTSGSDGNNGTDTGHPWRTLQYAESHATTAGSIIALKRGDNWGLPSGSVLAISHGGTTGDPITWDGNLWGTGGKAIISATGDHSDDHSAIVTITAAQHVVFQNIIIDGNNHYSFAGLSLGGNDWMDAPLKQNNERDITVQDCEVRNIGGFYANCLMTQTWHNDMYDITIQRNYVHDCSTWCIGFYMGKPIDGATPSTVHNLYIRNNTITNCQKTAGEDDGPGIGISGGVDVGIVEYNTITQGSGNPPSGIETAGDPTSLYAPQGLIVRYNNVNMDDKPSYVTQNGGPQQIQIYDNYFYTADPLDQATVIIYDGPYAGARFHFYDNTISSNGGLCYADQSGYAIFSSNNTFVPTNCPH